MQGWTRADLVIVLGLIASLIVGRWAYVEYMDWKSRFVQKMEVIDRVGNAFEMAAGAVTTVAVDARLYFKATANQKISELERKQLEQEAVLKTLMPKEAEDQ